MFPGTEMITEDRTGTEKIGDGAVDVIVRARGEKARLVQGHRPHATGNEDEAEAETETDDTGGLHPRGIGEAFGMFTAVVARLCVTNWDNTYSCAVFCWLYVTNPCCLRPTQISPRASA